MRIFQMQRVSAIALLVFLTIHMIVVHYPPFHIDFSRILVRMNQPLWKGIDIAFLFFVLIHALTGAYMVLTDVEPAAADAADPPRGLTESTPPARTLDRTGAASCARCSRTRALPASSRRGLQRRSPSRCRPSRWVGRSTTSRGIRSTSA